MDERSVLERADAIEGSKAPKGGSHRIGGAAAVKKDPREKKKLRVKKVDRAELVLKALDADGEDGAPQASPLTSQPAPPPPARHTTLPLADKPTTLSLDEILGSPDPAHAGSRSSFATPGAKVEAASATPRADELERAIFDTRSSHDGNEGGTSWPTDSRLQMSIVTINRWGMRASADIEVEVGRMRYSRRVYKPSDLVDMAYDENDERVLLLDLKGRTRPKRLQCADGDQRSTLASWLAAWKMNMHPDRFRDFNASRSGTFAAGASNSGTIGAVPAARGAQANGSIGAALSRAPNGRSGAVVLGASSQSGGRRDGAPREVAVR